MSVHHQAYDLLLLVAPAIAVITSSLPVAFLVRRRRVALIALVCLLGVNYVTTLSVLHRLEHERGLWVLLASLNGALLLVMFLVYVTPLIARPAAGGALPVAAGSMA